MPNLPHALWFSQDSAQVEHLCLYFQYSILSCIAASTDFTGIARTFVDGPILSFVIQGNA